MRKGIYAACAAIALFGSCAGTPNPVSYKTFKVAEAEPFEVGLFKYGDKSLFGSDVNQSESVVFFEPRTNTVRFEFRSHGVKYRVRMPETMRSAVIKAVAEYRKNFDERSLNISAKGTQKNYGREVVRIEWGVTDYKAEGETLVELGYLFVDRKTPYFTLTFQKGKNQGRTVDGGESDEYSPITALYFTKAQATNFAEVLLQENLLEKMKGREITPGEHQGDVY